MDANREVAREALRRCMEAEFAALPAEDGLDAPSPAFAARMEKLLRQEKKAASFRGRRVLVAAAIVAACLVLAAWTPVGGMVRSLLVTAPAELPEGFAEVYREVWDDYCFKVVWANAAGEELEFWQLATDGINGSVWGEDFTADTKDMGGRKVLLVRPGENASAIRTMATGPGTAI